MTIIIIVNTAMSAATNYIKSLRLPGWLTLSIDIDMHMDGLMDCPCTLHIRDVTQYIVDREI